MSKLKLIVGLGNPGQQYAQTRHNAGFWFVERLSETFNITMTLDKKSHGMVGRGLVYGMDIRLLLPHTFMNKSGEAVVPMVNFYGIHMFVVYSKENGSSRPEKSTTMSPVL